MGDGNEGVLRIPQSSSITKTSPSDCLVLYPGHSLGVGVLPMCRDLVGVFYSQSQLSKPLLELLQVTPLWVGVDLRVMVTKGYITLLRTKALVWLGFMACQPL